MSDIWKERVFPVILSLIVVGSIIYAIYEDGQWVETATIEIMGPDGAIVDTITACKIFKIRIPGISCRDCEAGNRHFYSGNFRVTWERVPDD